MANVSYKLKDLDRRIIKIGYVGENDHMHVMLDCKEAFDEYPNAAVAMAITPPEGEDYPKEVTRTGNIVEWLVTNSDVAAEGDGEFQLKFTENNVIKKSVIGRFSVERSIQGRGTAPSGVQEWLTDAQETLDDLAAMDNIAKTAQAGDIGKALSPKTVEDGVVTEWEYITPGGGTEDYTDLENKPSIAGVTLSGDKTLEDLGIAADDDLDDVAEDVSRALNAIQGVEQEEKILRSELLGVSTSVVMDGNGNPTSITYIKDNATVRTDTFVWGTDSVTETRTLANGKYITITTNLNTLAQTISEVQEVA